MKKFSTLQELWSYMLYCPFCKDVCREIHILAGPFELFEIKWFKKINADLTIRCLVKDEKDSCTFGYHIDCVQNCFTISVLDGNLNKINRTSVRCYLDLIGTCLHCLNSSANSASIELNLREKKLHNIGVEMEGLYFLSGKSKYHLTLNHYDGKLLVSRCYAQPDGSIIDDNKTLSFPLANFDFSDTKKVIKRIKTLLVFS